MDWKIRDVYKDEIRDNFLVTASRKKVWQVELELLQELDRICRRHGITYFADYGTLLGAVRHGGFIPWDDDIDVVMLRPDYEKFRSIAMEEVKAPLFLQSTYTDGFISAFSKLRHSQTSAIEFPDNASINQGIFIDIFPLDGVADGTARQDRLFRIKLELWRTVMDADNLRQDLQAGADFCLTRNLLARLLKLSRLERFAEFERFCLNHFAEAERLNFITDSFLGRDTHVQRKYYEEVAYLPFEGIKIPVPGDYHSVLRCRYGDYMQRIRGGSDHEGIILSADIPYREFLAADKK
ncbi:LicD family protein [Anaerovibrio slackiae]|uniref:LicD family protein n=1 Tax=Anaerovibrio slackiae TaxID=2652309 RepID=UPI003F1504A4